MNLTGRWIVAIFSSVLTIAVGLPSLVMAATATSSKETGFGISTGINFGVGKAQSSENSLASRNMSEVVAYMMPVYRPFAGFGIGPLLDYRITNQTTDPAEVSNTNAKGSAWLVGGGFSYSGRFLYFAASYDFLGTYTFSRPASTGEASSYQQPSGFHAVLGFKFSHHWSIDVMYSSHSYSKNVVGGTETEVSDKFQYVHYGAGLSYIY